MEYKIGIVYICTGLYRMFWENFYQSCERFFLDTISIKHYYVFTDSNDISSTDRIHVIYKDALGFPLDCLLRYHLFLSIQEMLKDCDYLFFFNANMLFVNNVGEDILPKDDLLVALQVQSNTPRYFSYERNKNSKAFIPHKWNREYAYYQACIWGGKTCSVLRMCKICNEWTKVDLWNYIIPKFLDESYFNRYCFDNDVHAISMSLYGWPEMWKTSLQPKIMQLDKQRFNPAFLKPYQRAPKSLVDKAIRRVKKYWYGLQWYFL